MNADGTNVQRLTNLEELEGQAAAPSRSPDGTQIVYTARISTLPWRRSHDECRRHRRSGDSARELRRVGCSEFGARRVEFVIEGSLDGPPTCSTRWNRTAAILQALPTPTTRATPAAAPRTASRGSPPTVRGSSLTRNIWIPGAGSFYVMSQRLDGTNRRVIARPTDVNRGYSASDWQPIPVNSYPRPAGATPIRVSLVVGFEECTTPNKIHGPPLEHPSCGDNFNLHHGKLGRTSQWARRISTVPPPSSSAACGSACRSAIPATPADEADLRLKVSTHRRRCRPEAAPATCGISNVVGADYVGELQRPRDAADHRQGQHAHAGRPGRSHHDRHAVLRSPSPARRLRTTTSLAQRVRSTPPRTRSYRGRSRRAIGRSGSLVRWRCSTAARTVTSTHPPAPWSSCARASSSRRAATRTARCPAARSWRPPRRRPRSPGSCPSRAP